MTHDELVARYQVIRDVSEGPPGRLRTLLAWPRVGEKEMIHFLEGPPAEDARLLAMIDRLGPPERDAVLERLEVGGQLVVITKFLDKRRTLKQWLETTVDPPPAEPRPIEPVAGPAPDESDSPGDVTVLFGPKGGTDQFPAPPPEPSSAGDIQAPVPIQAPEPVKTPGEFTQLFGAAAESGPPVIRKGPDLGPFRKGTDLGIVPEGPDLGAFPLGTDEVQGPGLGQGADLDSPKVAPGPQVPPPGEVTRLFQGYVGAADSPAESPKPPPPVSQPVPKRPDQGAVPPPSQGAVPPPPKVKPAPSGASPGELTQLFERYAGPADPPAASRKPPPPDSAVEPHQINWLGPELAEGPLFKAEGPLFKSDPPPSRAGEVDYLERLAAPPRSPGAPAGPLRAPPPVNVRPPEPFGVVGYPPLPPPPPPPSPDRAPAASVEVSPPGGAIWYLVGLALVVVVAIVLLIVVLT